MELVTDPVGHAPVRRLNSVRRTSSLDTTWPDGREGNLRMEGRCRDLKTGAELNQHEVARYDAMVASLTWERLIERVENDRVDLTALVGARGGGHLRAVLDEHIHEERVNGTPLYLVLDDISGASLVSGWAWSQWEHLIPAEEMTTSGFEEARKFMENVCHGFTTGFSALSATAPPRNNPPVVDLLNPADAESWHELPAIDSVNFRRARRIDVWVEGDDIAVDVGFQDSASTPDGGRVAIHEYEVEARADRASGVLKSVGATPHILPFPECPGAVNNIHEMVGTPLVEMRAAVIDKLPGTKGCTHLNDLLRGLAEVPALADLLD